MDVPPERVADAAGEGFAQMLEAHRTLLESIFGSMLSVAECSTRGWVLIRPGGYDNVTRNGWGAGLARFDWTTDYAGVTFARRREPVPKEWVIPEGGLSLLGFQVRWLDRAPQEPTVWAMALQVRGGEDGTSPVWEKYQSRVFDRLREETTARQGERGAISPQTIVLQGVSITVEGELLEVPVATLLTREDVLTQLVEPAFQLPPAEP